MRLISSAIVLGVMLMSLSSGVAQNTGSLDAGRKIRDGGVAHGIDMYQRHAQDRTQVLYYYSQSQQPVPKAEAKVLVSGIRSDLTASDKALETLKAAHAKDPEVMKVIAAIEKHHAKAHEVCNMAEEHCLKEHGDHVVIGDCCSEMWHEIDAARAETKKLLHMLKIDKLEVPKKVPGKKADSKKADAK